MHRVFSSFHATAGCREMLDKTSANTYQIIIPHWSWVNHGQSYVNTSYQTKNRQREAKITPASLELYRALSSSPGRRQTATYVGLPPPKEEAKTLKHELIGCAWPLLPQTVFSRFSCHVMGLRYNNAESWKNLNNQNASQPGAGARGGEKSCTMYSRLRPEKVEHGGTTGKNIFR
jgi:hypothetical protein